MQRHESSMQANFGGVSLVGVGIDGARGEFGSHMRADIIVRFFL